MCQMNMYLPAKYLEDGKVLYGASITIDMAYERIPAGIDNYIQDDIIQNPHLIYMGSFYHDKAMTQPDATANGHLELEDYGPKECVKENDKSPWGYHYHFKEYTNHS
ncbi:hypothetical protein [Anaerostipes butyraticus]|nr:hypothetical protein [Anaerostipes butyraticus]